ncbi:MAG: phosphoribosylformylglycinamidine cyclo-ligase [Microbacteriaceae bacterium]|nr:phosphoribosylformylglycinamidine cyclo-ligase [Microbacteriaceae bacterium]
MTNPYQASGVDTEAGDKAVELMKKSVAATHGKEVLTGLGGFAGLFDASALKAFQHPVLVSSTDGVGTKVDIAQKLGIHNTIGQDLVAMVVDDIIVTGAKSLFMTDYIATGKLTPEVIASIVEGIANACQKVDVALVGGETAEHPGLLEPGEYDVAGAAVGVVEKKHLLSPEKISAGDIVLGLPSSGLHSNGFSLVRKILADHNIELEKHIPEFGKTMGEELLTPTELYTGILNKALDENREHINGFSHITGGGIVSNIGRVLPEGVVLDIDRSAWSPNSVFRVLSDIAGFELNELESTWNLGLGFAVVVSESGVDSVRESLKTQGMESFIIGQVENLGSAEGYEFGGKGSTGGGAKMVGEYAK